MEDKIDIMSLTKSELKDFFTEIGEKAIQGKSSYFHGYTTNVYMTMMI